MASPTPQGPVWGLALGAALVTFLLVAVVVPRFFLGTEANWLLALGLAVLVGGALAVVGLRRTSGGRTERRPPDV